MNVDLLESYLSLLKGKFPVENMSLDSIGFEYGLFEESPQILGPFDNETEQSYEILQ